jgi:outer membrane protein assembly factor BamD (BamD/ComL family)
MRRLLTGVSLACALAGVGCSGDNAKELFETAQLEERQHNPSHARQLYEELVQKYPQTEYAKRAEQRLRELKPSP